MNHEPSVTPSVRADIDELIGEILPVPAEISTAEAIAVFGQRAEAVISIEDMSFATDRFYEALSAQRRANRLPARRSS